MSTSPVGRIRRITAALAVASLPLACGPVSDSRNQTGTVVETETIGDTSVIRTMSGSVWGEYVALVPETSIGATTIAKASWPKCAGSMQAGVGTVPAYPTTSRHSGASGLEATAGSG